MTVTSDSEVLDDAQALLSDWLHVVREAGARALVILGPCVTHDEGQREVIATSCNATMDSLLAGALALASSGDFLHWEGPLVAWQDLVRGQSDPPTEPGSGTIGWRDHFRSDGIISFVRVALELPGNRFFEIYTLLDRPLRTRTDAAPHVLAALGSWPDVRRQLVSSRLALSSRETAALRLVAAGHSSRTIAELMGITERTANYFVAVLTEKFRTKGRNTLPMRAAWLGLLD